MARGDRTSSSVISLVSLWTRWCRGLPGVGAAGSSGSHNGIVDTEKVLLGILHLQCGKIEPTCLRAVLGGAAPAGPGGRSGPPALISLHQLWNFRWNLHLKKHFPPHLLNLFSR